MTPRPLLADSRRDTVLTADSLVRARDRMSQKGKEPDVGWVDALLEETRPVLDFTLLHPDATVPRPYHPPLRRGLGVCTSPARRYVVGGGRRVLLDTDLQVRVPPGHLLVVVALQHDTGFEVFPEYIFPDWEGQIRICVRNKHRERREILPGQLVAQLVLVKMEERVSVRWRHGGYAAPVHRAPSSDVLDAYLV